MSLKNVLCDYCAGLGAAHGGQKCLICGGEGELNPVTQKFIKDLMDDLESITRDSIDFPPSSLKQEAIKLTNIALIRDKYKFDE